MVIQPLGRLALLIGAASPLAPVLAQPAADPDELADVLACADIEREILRLECYDDAVAAIQDRLAESGESASGRGATSRSSGGEAGAAEPAAGDDASASARSVGEGGASASARSSDADEDEDRPVTIVEVRTLVPGRAVFVTSEGEEFVQTSGRIRLFLPDVPFDAVVRTGAVGGTFLTPEGTRRSIRITERD